MQAEALQKHLPQLPKLPKDWKSVFWLAAIHIAALAMIPYLYFFGLSWGEFTFHLVAYLLGGFGITVLYHRVWTHNAAQLSKPVELFFAIVSAFCLQLDGKNWIRLHILHHQKTDHDEDPYSIKRGFWWAHQNWVLHKKPEELPRLPRRLRENAILNWQHRWYYPIFITLNVALPIWVTTANGGTWWGALLITSFRLALNNQMIYCINSLCHSVGTQKYTKKVSARDVWWFPFTLGEQYHNFHHAFPRDYRHGIKWYDFDPSKWLIWGLAKLRLAKGLYETSLEKITAARKEVATSN